MAVMAGFLRQAFHAKQSAGIDYTKQLKRSGNGSELEQKSYEEMTDEEKKQRAKEINDWFDMMEEKDRKGELRTKVLTPEDIQAGNLEV